MLEHYYLHSEDILFFLNEDRSCWRSGQVSTVHLQLGLPLVFIVGQQATYEADRTTAEWVAYTSSGKSWSSTFVKVF